ncbi:hypothetical protein KO507_16465 [Gilvimarinus agarilyticus]|uniref:hypothetical protein n=1 Tax=unclassified Gilvimarinus TaxID=2642066 RepID=UPI001C089AE7|nr:MULTISPECIES: hypothetical protein [unclassified Gilvimarinus]MBU2887361.1 hypothetical protein [Gilvimarinus agarilyticus]MDO6572019.1 hypothetical protein [Gilvimarinus sp. 2_MG-2023]MDO6746085.1 hypothetical protein [Gilvimarinus sp. 1_MG-2023]
MNTVIKIAAGLMTLLVTCVAQAHPHHSSDVSDHIHFSIASFALVAFLLVGYWVVSRYLRGMGERRDREDR